MSRDPCPSCAEELSLGGRFCHHCGWDADLAESEDAYLDGIELPDTEEPDFQFALHGQRTRKGRQKLWWFVALVVLAGILWAWAI